MANDLDQSGLALLKMLVDLLSDVEPADPSTFLSYTEAHERLGLRILFGHAGRSLQSQGLNSLAGWAHEHSVPAITGLIVRDLERDPGSGYFKLYGKQDLVDIPWWLGEVARAKRFDWTPYVGVSPLAATARTTDGGTAAPGITTLRKIAPSDSEFFLKSEYGPFSDAWPVVSFSQPALKVKLQREYRTGRDFIVYTGTSSSETRNAEHRGRLLSVVQIEFICKCWQNEPDRFTLDPIHQMPGLNT
jgi:hypothetical protein